MNTKKLLAVLVAGACGAPLFANAQDASPITVYGRLYPQFTVVSTNGATGTTGARNTLSGAPTGVEIPSHNEVQASNSRLGFRGKEKLGGGLEAFFQIESTILIDTGGGALATRDSFVGFGGGFGSVKLGNMDTVYKNYGDTLSFLGVSSGNFVSNSNIISKLGFGISSTGSFHLRRANSIVYDSPELSGFELSAGYSPDEARTATRNANVISVGGRYGGKKSPYFVAIAYEVHKDIFGGSNNVGTTLSNAANQGAHAKDTATRVTGSYTIGNTTFEGNYAVMKYNETGGATGRFQSYRHGAFNLALAHSTGPWEIAAAFASAGAGICTLVGGAVCTTDGLKGNQISIGSRYNFSKRNSAFLMYAKLKNDFAARYNNLANGNPANGSDISNLALGLQHAF